MVNYPLNRDDYETIAQHYGLTNDTKTAIENTMARKMCRCVKKVQKTTGSETPAIAICNKSIFRQRGLKFNKVTCKKRARFTKNRRDGWKLVKTRRNLRFRD